MSWTAPMTAVSNTAFTAAQFNTYVRDNFLETAPALASAPGQMFISDGVNSLVARTPINAIVTTSESVQSNSFTDLATVGPVVTAATGTNAIVAISADIQVGTDTNATIVSYAVSGATSIGASSTWGIVYDGLPANNSLRYTALSMQTNLNPGNNTFTMKYQAANATGTYKNREIVVIPF